MSVRSGFDTNNVRGRLSRSVLLALSALPLLSLAPAAQAPVLAGIDVLEQQRFAPLAGLRVGLITNVTGRTVDGRRTVDVLSAAPEVDLAAVFTPEHAFLANREGDIEGGSFEDQGIPLHSLYGETRRPTPAMLEGIDALVFDIQDIGTRIYTYATTLAYAMEEAARSELPIVVLDRPNPIAGTAVSGPVLDEEHISFVGYAPIPVRHGLTIGELARYFNGERGIGADLTVVPVSGWHREMWFDATGLEWTNPSPNIRNPKQALTYPALGPLEFTNISVGRGTDEPFEWFGAPWIDSMTMAATLNAAELPGLRVVPRDLTPRGSKYEGERCSGVYLEIVDRDRFDVGLTLATIAATMAAQYPREWDQDQLIPLWGDGRIHDQLNAGLSGAEIAASWRDDIAGYLERRARYLLYD